MMATETDSKMPQGETIQPAESLVLEEGRLYLTCWFVAVEGRSRECQTPHAAATNPYRIDIGTDRYEAI